MAVKVWQGEQQQRQDDLSKVDGTGRNRGCVFMVDNPLARSGGKGGPMARHDKPATIVGIKYQLLLMIIS